MKQVYHPYTSWECYQLGLFSSKPPKSKSKEMCLIEYANFLKNLELFESQLQRVIKEWPVSCENFLTNQSINRIAWLGQASMCIYSGISREFRGGYHLLSEDEKIDADNLACLYLNRWIKEYEKKDQGIPSIVGKSLLPKRNSRRNRNKSNENNPKLQGMLFGDFNKRPCTQNARTRSTKMQNLFSFKKVGNK